MAALEPLNHPEIFACLGMVIGLYGVLYLEVARRPEGGWLIALVGLAGKVLGPAGAAVLIARGDWPARAMLLCVGNDLVWWLPFGLYLRDAGGVGRRVPAESAEDDDLIGSWVEDPEVDAALEDQRRIDEDLWR